VRMDIEQRTRLQDQWQRRGEVPVLLCAVVFLAAYALPILDTSLSPWWTHACRIVVWATWAILVVDVAVRLCLSPDRIVFLRRNALDVAAAVLPILRPLRLLRLVVLLDVLNRFVGNSLRGRVAVYVGGSVSIVGFVASLAVLEAERSHPGANIQSFGDSIWWVMTTLSTVGYGDHYPVTASGRAVAVALMVVGVALLGVVTATLASWLIEQVREIEEESETATRREILALATEVRELRDAIEARDANHAR
jgi:voltage-gated potassium channel